jgi:hypothetical protein
LGEVRKLGYDTAFAACGALEADAVRVSALPVVLERLDPS